MQKAFLARSGQVWKLYLATALMVVSGSMIAIAFGMAPQLPFWAPIFVGFSLLGSASLGWASVSIRCDRCGTRLYWKALCEQRFMSWLVWLTVLEVCPVCGSDGSPTQHPASPARG
jgi:hypothetical protein